MDTVEVDSVLWRFITHSAFRGMNGLLGTDKGGSQKHIPLSGDTDVVEFFGFPSDIEEGEKHRFPIDVVGVSGIPESAEEIPIANVPSRHGKYGEWSIRDQHNNRYELWKPKYSFPDVDEINHENEDAYYDAAPPIIYFVRDYEENLYARATPDTTSDTLSDYPDRLASPWRESREKRDDYNFGVVEFNSETQTGT